jgi:ABC-type lipoprotein export system ATPase subunit
VAVLEFVDVRKQYTSDGSAVRAVDGVSLTVAAGELVALVGRSGCGKSTLLNLAGAMDFPTSGDVRIDGESTNGLDDAALTRLRRQKVGFIFQSFQLLPNLTAAENVELPLLLSGSSGARAAALDRLARVELEGLGHRYPHQLSGGQMQRVAIARALVHGPNLLLADEPIGNLDSATGATILALLRKIVTEERASIVMATHSAESTAVADRVIEMRDGRIISPA